MSLFRILHLMKCFKNHSHLLRHLFQFVFNGSDFWLTNFGAFPSFYSLFINLSKFSKIFTLAYLLSIVRALVREKYNSNKLKIM